MLDLITFGWTTCSIVCR